MGQGKIPMLSVNGPRVISLAPITSATTALVIKMPASITKMESLLELVIIVAMKKSK
jgi:hypothetical protein